MPEKSQQETKYLAILQTRGDVSHLQMQEQDKQEITFPHQKQ